MEMLRATAKRKGRSKCLDMFSGCLGLTLGIADWFKAIAYVERHPPAIAVIKAILIASCSDCATCCPMPPQVVPVNVLCLHPRLRLVWQMGWLTLGPYSRT